MKSFQKYWAIFQITLINSLVYPGELIGRSNGADFAALASSNSTDPGSASQGGSLGWSPTSAYVTEFADAANTMAKGEISDPVKSDFGWHIIRKNDEMKEGEPIDQAPEELKTLLSANSAELALQEYVTKLREDADIEYVDETLAPEEAE